MVSAGFRHKSGVNGGSDFKSCVIIHYIAQNSRKEALWGLGGQENGLPMDRLSVRIQTRSRTGVRRNQVNQ